MAVRMSDAALMTFGTKAMPLSPPENASTSLSNALMYKAECFSSHSAGSVGFVTVGRCSLYVFLAVSYNCLNVHF